MKYKIVKSPVSILLCSVLLSTTLLTGCDKETLAPTTNLNTTVSNNWTDLEMLFDGHYYKLPCSYQDLADNGWQINFTAYGYENGHTLKPGARTPDTIYLENPKYNKEIAVTVGFINNSTESRDITECDIWSFEYDAPSFQEGDCASLEIANGIHIGSSEADTLAAFGTYNETYTSKTTDYITYSYENDLAHLYIAFVNTPYISRVKLQSNNE